MSVRSLNQTEAAAVQAIFEIGLQLERVRISEETPIGNWVGRFGAWLKRQPPPEANAITVGNTSYFPRRLTGDLADMGWLIHELTHQWQYQHVGLRYLFQAMFAPTYDYVVDGLSPNAALRELREKGWTFDTFNREQQGNIVRDYYWALTQGADVSGWVNYLADIRTPPR